MTTNELMLCDWVQDEDGELTSVTEDMMWEGYDWQPVPLTEEILKKNGFEVHIDEGDEYDYIQCWKQRDKENQCVEYGIDIYRRSDETVYRLTLETHYEYFFECRKTIRYVHELQQALRMSGMLNFANSFII